MINLLIALALSAAAIADDFGDEREVAVRGFAGNVMEPFLSRDGGVLFFNDLGRSDEEKDLHFALSDGVGGFDYSGPIANANSAKVDGAPSMDSRGNFFFVSSRSYDETHSTLYQATYRDGGIGNLRLVAGDVSRKKPLLLNMDAEISADGERLYFNDNRWNFFGRRIGSADLSVARRRSGEFERLPEAAAIFAKISTSAFEYAPALSADETTLYFTRADFRKVRQGEAGGIGIYVSRRHAPDAAFEEPARIKAITGFVEGPTISPDGCILYYHRKVGETFRLFKVTRRSCME